MTFDQFLDAIDVLAKGDGIEGSYVEQTGHECWRDSFDDDMTPDEAWAEERSAAAELAE
jgi:hypothetical protein